MIATDAPVAPRRLDSTSLWTLLAGNGLTELGVGFFLPILPLFLSRRGGSPAFVGAVIAAGVLGKLLAQYPAGRLSDRFGRRPLITGSLAVYSLCFLLYLAPLPLVAFLPLRFLQAATIGFYLPAATALLADLTPVEMRSAAFARMRATEMTGLLAGPVAGGFAAGIRLDSVFIAAATLCMLATLLLLRLPRTASQPEAGIELGPAAAAGTLVRLVPVIALGAAVYYTIGNYDAIWTLYVTARGGSTLQVGLSFGVYALPIVLVSAFLGHLADRWGPRRTGVAAVAAYGFFNLLYPLISQPWLLVAAGFVEGAATALGTPALSAEVSRAAPPGRQGATQGAYNTMLNVALGAGSLAGGFLFAAGPRAAFWVSAGICGLGIALAWASARVLRA